MLKHNIEASFPSYKLSWIQNDGVLLIYQQVKENLFIGHYAKIVLSHIVPLEACDVLLKLLEQFDCTLVYHDCFNKIIFTYRGNKFVASFAIFSQVVKTNYKHI